MKKIFNKENLGKIPASIISHTRPIIYSRRRVRLGLTVTIVGFLVFMLGARPVLFGLDRSPVIGFVQIAVFLIGLALICIGGYFSLIALWKYQKPSIAADIGMRLVATGYVVTVFAGMADVFGFGSHGLPDVPFFGPWQALGVEIGELLIGIGFLMMVPYSDPERRVGRSREVADSTNENTSSQIPEMGSQDSQGPSVGDQSAEEPSR